MGADHYMRSTVSNNMLGPGWQSGNYPNTLVLELLQCNALHCREQVCMVGNYAARQITDNCAGLPIVAWVTHAVLIAAGELNFLLRLLDPPTIWWCTELPSNEQAGVQLKSKWQRFWGHPSYFDTMLHSFDNDFATECQNSAILTPSCKILRRPVCFWHDGVGGRGREEEGSTQVWLITT